MSFVKINFYRSRSDGEWYFAAFVRDDESGKFEFDTSDHLGIDANSGDDEAEAAARNMYLIDKNAEVTRVEDVI